MCGIVGYIGDYKHEAALKSIHHRGPDAQDFKQQNVAGRNVLLGHTRLSIIDLSTLGNQPMSSPDNKVHIVYNGEVYNFMNLREQVKDYSFRSGTDTETILALYLNKGIGFIQSLNGAFAITILDERTGKLYLIRDRAGIKPFYYHKDANGVVFSSEIKGIISCGVNAKLNTNHLQRYFVFKYSPGNETLFNGVNRIPQGSYLEVDVATLQTQVKTYWKANVSFQSGYNYKEKQEELKELLNDAVQIRLMADVPVATFLSGGLDSTIIAHHLKGNDAITHYCARKSEADIKKEGTTSDYQYAKQLANEWNLQFRELHIGGDELTVEMIRKTVYYSDDLIADGSQIPSYLITERAGQEAKVVLSGMGADEIFMGYAGHMLTLLSLYMDKVPFGKKMLAGRMGRIEAGKGKFKAFKRYLVKLGKYYNDTSVKYGKYSIVGDFDNSRKVFNGNEDSSTSFLENYFSLDRDPFESFQQFEFENFLVKNLNYVDRMAMANGMENRVPFLDHRIIELAHQLKRSHKLSNSGVTKRILKDAYQADLPGYVVKRRKAGFGMPLRSLLDNEKKLNELMDLDFFAEINGFDLEHIRRLRVNHINGKEDNSSILYALISFEHWYKQFIKD